MRNFLLPSVAVITALMTGTVASAAKPTTVEPASDPATWVVSDDYPADALEAGVTGRVAFRVQVGADGLPMDCAITSSSGSESLDKQTCALIMQRATFEPGRDGHGTAVQSVYSDKVHWILPDGPPPAPMVSSFTFVVGVDGKTSGCTPDVPQTPQYAWAKTSDGCSRMSYTPYRDEKGNPVARRVTVRTVTTVDPVEAAK